jgi:ankyrin repeat protein
MNLLNACMFGKLDQAKEALANGEDPTYNDNIAIQWACFHGHTKIVELLLQDGRADPTTYGNQPIKCASYNGYALLLKDGRADPTTFYNYSIRAASENGHVDVVSLLLQDGRVEVPDSAINHAATDEIKEMMIAYKYRVDGKEYQKAKNDFA